MPVLRDVIMPTLGLPQQAIAPSRRARMSRMNQPDFYTQQLQQPQPQPLQQLNQSSPPVDQPQLMKQQTSQFEQDPMSGEYIKQQLASYANRTAPPQLDPSARVKSPNMELVQPSNFQQFYQQLSSIDQFGQEMTATSQAKSAFKRAKELKAIQDQQVQAFKGANLTNNNTSGSTGQAFGKVPSNPKANFSFAQQIGPNYGWDANELGAWYTLGMKESGWNNNAQNPTSTAYGIGQFLNSTWSGVGIGKTSDPKTQVEAMARYIKNRYGSPSKALAFHLSHNWY